MTERRRRFGDVKMARELAALGVISLLGYSMLSNPDNGQWAVPCLITVLGGWLDLFSSDRGRRRQSRKHVAKT